jgi:UDP-N-acetyl-D-mannosaminuronic acid dehydrogenase
MEVKGLKVCIIGLGYIGLPTAALLANNGHKVIGVDINNQVVNTINQGEIHIVEPDLDAFVKSAVSSNMLRASLLPEASDVFIIAVPTPFKEGHKPDLKYVEAAVKSIVPIVKPGNMVILESTSPVGTTKKVCDILSMAGISTDDLYVAYCPERVLPGKIMRELIENDRVVGGINEMSTAMVKKFYQTFVTGTVLETNASTAEMCKLVENAYRDVNIAFANELSLICHSADVDVRELIDLANHHPRVNILNPGVGVGGHCIAVDPWFLVADYPSHSNLIRTAREVNDNKTLWVIEQIADSITQFEVVHGVIPKVVLLGLSFKPDIDDLRESPALFVARQIAAKFTKVFCVEPNVASIDGLELISLSEAKESADLCFQLVNHKEFQGLKEVCNKKFRSF